MIEIWADPAPSLRTPLSNETLACSKSANTVIYQFFEVDAATTTRAAIEELTKRLQAAVKDHPGFFSASHEAWAHFHALSHPLKYNVRRGAAATVHVGV